MPSKLKAPKITKKQREQFDAITDGKTSNLVLLSGRFRGKPAAYIAATKQDGEDTLIFPIAIMVDAAFLRHFGNDIADPYGDVPSKHPVTR